MSNFSPTENRIGIQPIQQSNAATPSQYQVGQSPEFGQNHPLGTIVRAQDLASSLGEGEFVYLAGAANTTVGSLVIWNSVAGTTTLSPNTAHLGEPVAVAMSANTTATSYGWYQISGVARVKKTAVKVNPNVNIFLSATTGRVSSVVASGKEIVNAITVNAATVASATSTVLVSIMRPFAQGQVI